MNKQVEPEWANFRTRTPFKIKVEKYVEAQHKKFPNKSEFQSVPNYVLYVLTNSMERNN